MKAAALAVVFLSPLLAFCGRVAVLENAKGRHTTEFDAAFAELGVVPARFNDAKASFERFLDEAGNFDLVLVSPLFNYDAKLEGRVSARPLKAFVENGGMLVITDFVYPGAKELFASAFGELEALSCEKCTSSEWAVMGQTRNVEPVHPLRRFPNRLSDADSWPHFEKVPAGWTTIVKCSEGKSVVIFKAIGKGCVVASALRHQSPGAVENLLAYSEMKRGGIDVEKFLATEKRFGRFAQKEPAGDGIKDGVHDYTREGYVQPKEPEVRERLEWFKDQKLALMLHFGLYSVPGIVESWSLSDEDAKWSRAGVTWTDDAEEFKRQYWALNKAFYPVRLEPKAWAKTARDCGFKYLIFTTKHHDGFCLFDSRYSNYKTTAPDCPFSSDPRADIVRHVFDAFRAEGLGIAAYFSKPDWHHEDYWENCGMGRTTTRRPTYDVGKNPAKWARFKEFTKNQILELVRDYGKVDILWLDGAPVQRKEGLDINIEEIVAEARKINPGLISVDRTAGGACENVITPEQMVPGVSIDLPWESCITIGRHWGYFYDEEYKSVREIVHMLVDVVAKGGNLALNVGPQPDGRLPQQALERLKALGAWLEVNGEAIYETRPLSPFRKGEWAFTRNRRMNAEYAIRLWKADEKRAGRQQMPGVNASLVVHVGTGRELVLTQTAQGAILDLPDGFNADAHPDVFRICAEPGANQEDWTTKEKTK